jgi:hypothetical protein
MPRVPFFVLFRLGMEGEERELTSLVRKIRSGLVVRGHVKSPGYRTSSRSHDAAADARRNENRKEKTIGVSKKLNADAMSPNNPIVKVKVPNACNLLSSKWYISNMP